MIKLIVVMCLLLISSSVYAESKYRIFIIGDSIVSDYLPSVAQNEIRYATVLPPDTTGFDGSKLVNNWCKTGCSCSGGDYCGYSAVVAANPTHIVVNISFNDITWICDDTFFPNENVQDVVDLYSSFFDDLISDFPSAQIGFVAAHPANTGTEGWESGEFGNLRTGEVDCLGDIFTCLNNHNGNYEVFVGLMETLCASKGVAFIDMWGYVLKTYTTPDTFTDLVTNDGLHPEKNPDLYWSIIKNLIIGGFGIHTNVIKNISAKNTSFF